MLDKTMTQAEVLRDLPAVVKNFLAIARLNLDDLGKNWNLINIVNNDSLIRIPNQCTRNSYTVLR